MRRLNVLSLAGLPTLRLIALLSFCFAAAGCQPERTSEQALDHILAQPSFTVWVDNMHLSWSVRVEPSDSGRVVNTWRGSHPFERRWEEPVPDAGFTPVRYTREHEALIREMVSVAGVDSAADEFGVIRSGLEGGGELVVLSEVASPLLDSLQLQLVKLGH